jgi:pimeloyl-ACP methyl ester carboxylesterase
VSDLSVEEIGAGPVLLLIHGFPMNRHVWDDFRILLSKNYRTITVDLPGFGDSRPAKKTVTIPDIADTLLAWLTEKNITNCIPVGHSLGGYVALAMIEKAPEKFAGLCLFHSTAFADTEEKKLSRSKVIDFIERNGVLSFTSNFIPPLFADPTHPAIEKVRSIAIQSAEETVIAYTVAMRERLASTTTLGKFKKPVLFLAGEKDAGIPVETMLEQSDLTKHPEVHILEGIAHMGMFENPKNTAKIIHEFSQRCFG